MSGPPTIYSMSYLKGNIEGGEKFNWYYNDGTNRGHGLDPNGSDLIVSLPEGDRLAQSRSPYNANQQILANKQLRWWWNNLHYAVYANSSGAWVPQGPQTEWAPNSKSILMLEYGIPAVDKGTNQPNVFYDPKSVESFTPYWSIWNPANEDGYLPQRDDTIQAVALEAIYEYWNVDGNNAAVGGLPMVIEFAFSCVWNWDARPFPHLPDRQQRLGRYGELGAELDPTAFAPSLPPPPRVSAAVARSLSDLPVACGRASWSVHIKPKFSTIVASHVSGRETRSQRCTTPISRSSLRTRSCVRDALHLELRTSRAFSKKCPVKGQSVLDRATRPQRRCGPGDPEPASVTTSLSAEWPRLSR